MARSRKRSHLVAGELNLTAMIDVAFQMLNFFVITMKPVDVLCNLDVSRPAPGQSKGKATSRINFLRITILPDGNVAINDRLVRQADFERQIGQLTSLDKSVTVMICCTPQSPHGKLVETLDLCSKVGLTNLSLVSVD